MSESQYLARQAADAKEAMSRAAHELTNDLGQTVNLAGWTREFPWLTLATATVAGFVAANVLVPSKEQQVLNRLRAIDEALKSSHQPAAETNGKSSPPPPSLWSKLGHQLLNSLPAILSAVSAGISSKMSQTDESRPPSPENPS